MAGVNVNTRSAPTSSGAPAGTDTWFLTAKLGSKLTPVWVRDTAEFEANFSGRTGNAVPAWDALDVFFRSGGKQACIGSYSASGGTYADGLLLLNDARLGPGQLSDIGDAPGAQMFSDFAAAAQANNRIALMDVNNGDTVSAMATLGDALPLGTTAVAEYIGLFGSWLSVPGPSGVIGAGSRVVPASPVIAALCALVDEDGNPNRAPAGPDYGLRYINSFVLDPVKADRDMLLAHRVNCLTNDWGINVNYTFQSAVTRDPATAFWQLSAGRTRMFMKWQAQLRGAKYRGRSIDAQGRLASQLKADLVDMLLDLHGRGGLYGDTPQDAFDVNVGVTVNNTSSAASAILAAVAQTRISEYADDVNIDLVSVPILGSVVTS